MTIIDLALVSLVASYHTDLASAHIYNVVAAVLTIWSYFAAVLLSWGAASLVYMY